MPTFRLALRVVARHWVYIVIYLVTLTAMGLFVTMGYSSDTESFRQDMARVAVIDRDGSELSESLAKFLATFSIGAWDAYGELTPVEDSRDAIADAVASDVVSYVLIVPEGFAESFMAAAKAGAEAPVLETVVSYQSGSAALMDLRCEQYLQAAYGFASSVASDDQALAARLATETMAEQAEIVAIPSEVEGFNPRLVGYFGWCMYPLFTAATVLVSVLMNSFGQTDVKRRLTASPTTLLSRTCQTYLACLVLDVMSWLWVAGLGVAVDGTGVIAESGAQLALMLLSLLAYALFAVSFGYLVGQFGVPEPAANAIANVGGLLLSFLGGAWVSLDILGEGVQAVSRLTPSYWAADAISSAHDIASVSWANALPSLASTGIVALFALACLAIALAVRSVTRGA